MKDMLEQIYDELNAQVIRMLEHGRKQADRIAELERENSSLAYELNVALSATPSLSDSQIDDMAFGYVPSGQIGELREFARAILAYASKSTPIDTNGLPG